MHLLDVVFKVNEINLFHVFKFKKRRLLAITWEVFLKENCNTKKIKSNLIINNDIISNSN